MALLIAPAHAQLRGKGSKRSEGNQQFDEQKKKNSAAEKAYKDALRRIPDQKVSDPWSTVRSLTKCLRVDSRKAQQALTGPT